VVITTTTISGNSSGTYGAGLQLLSGYPGVGSVSISSSTIASNTSDSGGGGIHILGTTEPTTLANTIVADNAPVDCGFQSGSITSNGHNLDSDNSCSFGHSRDLPGTTNPLLGPLQDNGGPTLTHELQEGSPAIDAGTCAIGEITDQRGFPRPIDTPGVPNVDEDGCDIGAYEDQLAVTSLEDGSAGSLRSVIADAPPGSRIGFVVTGTINLRYGELVIDKDLTIEGPGAGRLVVDGGRMDRAFRIIEGVKVEISGLTVRGGDAGPEARPGRAQRRQR
jgi:hypothetical protein